MNRIISILIVLGLFGCAAGQMPVETGNNQRLERARTQILAEDLVKRMFDHGEFDVIIQTATEMALATSRPALESNLGRELTRTEDEKLKTIYESVFRELYPKQDWIKEFAKIYANTFDADELQEILAFYQSKAGERMLQMETKITKDGENVGKQLFVSKQDLFVKRFGEEISKAFSIPTTDIDKSLADTQELSIADTIQSCKTIQSTKDIPIGCGFDYINGQPTMYVLFQSLDIANQYWNAISERVANPFCLAANKANRQALVILALTESNQARIYSCESEQWGDWINYNETKQFN